MRPCSLAVLLLLGSAVAAQTTAQDPLTEAARTVEGLIADGEEDAMRARWDLDGFSRRVGDGLDLPFDDVRRGVQQSDPFHRAIVEAVGLGASYRFLRVVERDGDHRARFRLIDPEGGVDYHDLLLVPDATGTYRLVDAYVFMNGEDISRTVQRVSQGLIDVQRPSERPSPRARHVREFSRAIQRGDLVRALEVYPRISPASVDRKPLLMLYLRLASGLDLDQYRKGLEHFAREYATDPGAALVLVDYHTLRGDIEAALASVDTLDAELGGDPFLDDLRISLYLIDGRTAEATEAADRLARSLPDLAEAQYPRLDLALTRGDFETVADGLLMLEREHGAWFDPAALKEDPGWESFVASAAYKRWVRERP